MRAVDTDTGNQGGFTLIEIIVVLMILGVLAAVAVPKFYSFEDDARQKAIFGIAASLSSASSLNFALRSVEPTKGVAINDCSDVVSLMEGDVLPSGYSIVPNAVAVGTVKADCVVQHSLGQSANFTVYGIN